MTMSLLSALLWLVAFPSLLLTAPVACGQIPMWQTALAITTSTGSQCYPTATAIDSLGNVYVTGYFKGDATFGTVTLNAFSAFNIFAAKWNPATGFLWAKLASSNGDNFPRALVVRGNRIYIAGNTTGNSLRFGNSRMTINNRQGVHNVFVARLTDSGTVATWSWAQASSNAGAAGESVGLAVRDSSLYLTGYYTTTMATFGSTVLSSTSETAYVAKLIDRDTAATWQWALAGGGINSNAASANIAVNGNKVYVSGNFDSPMANFGDTYLTGVGDDDFYIAKLIDNDSTAAWKWAKGAGGTRRDDVLGMTANGDNVYLTGGVNSNTIFFDTLAVSKPPGGGLFVAKVVDHDSVGAWGWIELPVAAAWALGIAITDSNLYLAGSYYGRSTFGNVRLTDTGGGDAFVAKLTDNGPDITWQWARSAGGSNYDYCTAVSPWGNHVYVAGVFTSSMLFDNTTITNPASLLSTGFLAALTDPILGTAEDNVGLPAFTLAPNPAHHTATLSGAAPGMRFTVCDALGRAVLTATADAAGTAPLDVRALRAGLYLVRAEGRAGARRLVVE